MKIKIYGTESCPFCVAAAEFCAQKNLEYQKIDLTAHPGMREKISAENGHFPTIPMIFADDDFLGGFDALSARFQ